MKLKLDSFRILAPPRPNAPINGNGGIAPAPPKPAPPQPRCPDVFQPPIDLHKLDKSHTAKGKVAKAIDDFAMAERAAVDSTKPNPLGTSSSGLMGREEFNAKAKDYLAEQGLLGKVSGKVMDQLLADGYKAYAHLMGSMSPERRRPIAGTGSPIEG